MSNLTIHFQLEQSITVLCTHFPDNPEKFSTKFGTNNLNAYIKHVLGIRLTTQIRCASCIGDSARQ